MSPNNLERRRQRRLLILLLCMGAFTGIADAMNWLALYQPTNEWEPVGQMLVIRLILSALGGAVAFWVIRSALRYLVARSAVQAEAKQRYLQKDTWSFAAFGVWWLGCIGLQFGPLGNTLIGVLFAMAQLSLLLWPIRRPQDKDNASLGVISVLFLVSGFAALIYQVVWQRVLFTSFGVNIESITIVVSLFMFGLGVGSMVGGILSKRYPEQLPRLFLICEIAIGLFGIVSLALIRTVSDATVDGSLATISLSVYALLSIPTMFMGATLPILVAHLYTFYKHTGKAVGLLYFLNTIGSAIACFVTTDILFVLIGLQSSVWIAACCNIIVGVVVYFVMLRLKPGQRAEVTP